MSQTTEKIDSLLKKFNETNAALTEIVEALRELVNPASNGLKEEVKYGGLVFLKGQELLGGVFLRKAFVTMEFSFGNELKDDEGHLEGTGKLRRNLKFKSLSDIKDKQAKYYIEQAFA